MISGHVIIYLLAFVRALLLVDVPLQMTCAKELLDLVAAFIPARLHSIIISINYNRH